MVYRLWATELSITTSPREYGWDETFPGLALVSLLGQTLLSTSTAQYHMNLCRASPTQSTYVHWSYQKLRKGVAGSPETSLSKSSASEDIALLLNSQSEPMMPH